jgi:hypothetical protein
MVVCVDRPRGGGDQIGQDRTATPQGLIPHSGTGCRDRTNRPFEIGENNRFDYPADIDWAGDALPLAQL